MDFRLHWARLALVAAIFALVMGAADDARAQAALDEDDDAQPATTQTDEDGVPTGPRIGVGLRLRNVRLPQSLIDIFVDHSPGGSSELGFGAEIARRKGNFEFTFGIEYDKIDIPTGRWVEKDKPIPQNEVDYVEFDGFGWITADVTFINHTPFGRYFALRYGGGAGLGILLGEVKKTDHRCTDMVLDHCQPYDEGDNQEPYDLPPVFPVLNAVFGAQVTPTENIAINFELGLRTLPFIGTSAVVYF